MGSLKKKEKGEKREKERKKRNENENEKINPNEKGNEKKKNVFPFDFFRIFFSIFPTYAQKNRPFPHISSKKRKIFPPN